MILCDRCSTSYDPVSLFRGRRSSLDRWSRKIEKKKWYEAVSSALNFPFLKEVSQYTSLQLQLHYFTLQYTRLHYTISTIPRYSTKHYSTLQNTTLITPHHNYNCNCNYATLLALLYNYNLKLQLHYTIQIQLQLQLHYTTLHPAVVVRWPLQPLQPLQKTQLQPPFGPSVHSLCHPWFTTTNLSYRFPIFETSATALCGTTGILVW